MLKHTKQASKPAPVAVTFQLLVFRIGGHTFAAMAEEVGGVQSWPTTTPVPSSSRFVTAVARRYDEVLPVYDLAGQLSLSVRDSAPLALLVKHALGPLIVRIDSEIPSLETVGADMIRPASGLYPGVRQVCRLAHLEVPMLSLRTLGTTEGSVSA
jgi:chemotaxis signal transduction protein